MWKKEKIKGKQQENESKQDKSSRISSGLPSTLMNEGGY